MTPARADDDDDADAPRLELVSGRVTVHRGMHGGSGGGDAAGDARLSWTSPHVSVTIDGARVPEHERSCTVSADSEVSVTVASDPAHVRYDVEVARDRMRATLRVVPVAGVERSVVDAVSTGRELRIEVTEVSVAATAAEPGGDLGDALAQLQRHGVVFGVHQQAVGEAVARAHQLVCVAEGQAPIEGRAGRLEELVDFAALRTTGVPEGTELVRRVRKREGRNGTDVTGRSIAVAPVGDAHLRAGPGVVLDDDQLVAVASVAGAPYLDSSGRVEMRQELALERVDAATGDIDFAGSVRVAGDVAEGRTVVAHGDLTVDGNVDRACLESGGRMIVHGAIMSSRLRAGGERAVSVRMLEHLADVPRDLAAVSTHARELRDAALERGSEIGHGLSVQLVIERMYGGCLANLKQAADMLAQAGDAHRRVADQLATFRRELKTAAIDNLGEQRMVEIVAAVSRLVDEAQRAVSQASDMTVSYMQASEAEATGCMHVVGKGIFNSKITAWGGVKAATLDAVVRGGSITSSGDVHVREIGCPGGARMTVSLGAGASLAADHVYAGTVVIAPGFTHRFMSDRCDVRAVMTHGSINVESLAA